MFPVFHSKIDRDFEGGIYLPGCGAYPSLDLIGSIDYEGPLFLPLTVFPAAGKKQLNCLVKEGQAVRRYELLARQDAGYRLYSPREGVVKGIRTIEFSSGLSGNATTPEICSKQVLVLEVSGVDGGDGFSGSGPPLDPLETILAADQKKAVPDRIEQAGILNSQNSEPLADQLRSYKGGAIDMIAANATPAEGQLEGPLAILGHYPEQIFVGLSILKRLLGAHRAVAVYPHHFPIRSEIAARWEVECLAVSDKYPQARAASIIRTLVKQKYLPSASGQQEPGVLVVDIQLLREVERAILGGEPPVERVVTISGTGVDRPGHYRVPLGMPLSVLLDHAGMKSDAECVLAGTSMTGRSVHPRQEYIDWMSQDYTVIEKLPSIQGRRCIRCGWCIENCPAGIDPMGLYDCLVKKGYSEKLQATLDRCIECGICSYICPGRLPLMQRFQRAKQ